jgi:rhodanese-related sulfurtransferase
VALRLKRRGITRVRPLAGGMAEWMARGFPVHALTVPAPPTLEQSTP